MSAYRVGRSGDGSWGWWPAYEPFGHAYTEIRDATPEECALMEKIEWHTASRSDIACLRMLLKTVSAFRPVEPTLGGGA